LHHDRDRDREQRGQRPGQREERAHRMLPSGSMTLRSLRVPDGTTTPTRSRAEKSTNGWITARWLVSRRLEETDWTVPTGTPAMYGAPSWLPQVTTVSPFAGT